MSISNLVKSFQRNKRLKAALYGIFIITVLFNFYGSIHGISSKRDKLTNSILKSKSKPTSLSSYQIFNQDYSNVKTLPNDSDIREQLHFQYPYNRNEPFPKLIWQTWKVARNDDDFKAKFFQFSEQWIDRNPDYSYNMIPDSAAHDLIKHLYSNIPKVLKAYDLLPKSILKADFFRYLILFARGGVYADIDTTGLKPVDVWVSANRTLYNEPNDVGLVIGIEADPDRPDWNEYYAKRVQFCQWSIQSKKGHPMLGELISRITEITLQKQKDGTLNKVVGKDAGGDIMNWTGPGIYTDEIFKFFNEIIKNNPKPHIINKTKTNKYNNDLNIYKDGVDWKFFTLMEEPIVFEDVLVLPITSFSPGVGHMGSRGINHHMAYVRHMFEGSWKDDEEKPEEKKTSKTKPKKPN